MLGQRLSPIALAVWVSACAASRSGTTADDAVADASPASGAHTPVSHELDATVPDARARTRDANAGATGAPVPAAAADAADAAAADSSAIEDAAADAAPWPDEDSSCLDGITDYAQDGPFAFDAATVEQVKLWLPRVPEGCRVPMVHVANGTGATCSVYQPLIERLASHGFLVVCYENTNTGSGAQVLQAFQTALREYPELAARKFGSTGHGAGGQGALIGLWYAEGEWGPRGLYAALGIQPESGFGAQPPTGSWSDVYAQIASPVFVFSGQGSDGLVSQQWVQRSFDALSDAIEAYHWTQVGGHHIPVPNEEAQRLCVPWFRWKLLGDAQACRAFKAIRDEDPDWIEAAVQNEQPCAP